MFSFFFRQVLQLVCAVIIIVFHCAYSSFSGWMSFFSVLSLFMNIFFFSVFDDDILPKMCRYKLHEYFSSFSQQFLLFFWLRITDTLYTCDDKTVLNLGQMKKTRKKLKPKLLFHFLSNWRFFSWLIFSCFALCSLVWWFSFFFCRFFFCGYGNKQKTNGTRLKYHHKNDGKSYTFKIAKDERKWKRDEKRCTLTMIYWVIKKV